MKGHLAPPHKGGAADLADERPLARVHAPVLVHVALLRERLAAVVAAERFVAGMNSQVSVEVGALREPESREPWGH